MLQRCYNTKHKRYKDYGGRGIKVCERWRENNGLDNFTEDMGERPSNYTLDRKNNNDNYTCGKCSECKTHSWLFNCRWVSRTVQQINRRIQNNNKSGTKGVYWVQSQRRWRVRIGLNGKQITLGYYIEKQAAINARRIAEKKYFAPLLNN
jgi:hypothetical protein